MLPPQSAMIRDSSFTAVVGSPPTAEMTMSCSIYDLLKPAPALSLTCLNMYDA
jgi:hypothetical protein